MQRAHPTEDTQVGPPLGRTEEPRGMAAPPGKPPPHHPAVHSFSRSLSCESTGSPSTHWWVPQSSARGAQTWGRRTGGSAPALPPERFDDSLTFNFSKSSGGNAGKRTGKANEGELEKMRWMGLGGKATHTHGGWGHPNLQIRTETGRALDCHLEALLESMRLGFCGRT